MAWIYSKQIKVSGSFDINDERLINVQDPSESQDATTKIYVDQSVESITGSISSTFTGSGDVIDIGNPADGTYDDGFFEFTSSTKIADAIDDISEAFLDIAPVKASTLTGEDLTRTNPSVFSGKLSTGLNPEWYIGYNSSDTISILTSATTIDLRTPSISDTFRAGKNSDFTPLNILTGGVTASVVYGSGALVASSSRALDLDTGTTGIINISALDTYNTFWVKANARINDTNSITGSIKYKISADQGADETNDYQLFYVGGGGDFPDQSFSVSPVTGSTSETLMYLSGILYYDTGTTWDVSYTAQNLYNPVYAIGNQSYISSTYFTNVAVNYGGTPADINDLTVTDNTRTLLSGQTSTWGNLGTGTATIYKPNKSNVSSNFDLGDKPINSRGNISTDLIEYFYDEQYRNIDENSDGWTSANALTDSNLQVQNGRLINGLYASYGGFSATTQSYHRNWIPQNSNGNGTMDIDRTGFTEFVESYQGGSSKLQIIFRANGKIYDLGRAVGDDSGSIYGIRDSISGEIITWALPTGDTVNNGNPFKMEIIFYGEGSGDYINDITMTFNQG